MDIQTLKTQLTASLKSKIWIPELTSLGEVPGIPLIGLHDCCYDERHRRLAFRAAWLLEYIAFNRSTLFATVAEAFLIRLPRQKNPSCQRHFTNILRRLTHPRAPKPYRDVMQKTSREQLVETVFHWFIDPCTPVAVQANCMDVLLHLSGEYEWIRDELKQQIEFLLRDGSAAIQSRGKKTLEKLARIRSGG
ncbi:hypothetical protein [Parapedobacter sp.]